MKYLKGTFNTIPNKNQLRGKPAEMQSIFFWIVDHANEEGTCFPSRKTLAKESGCNIKTVDKYIAQLIEEGFISKTLRRQEGSKKRSSNFYQLLMVNTESGSNQETENGSNENTEKGAVTIPILTKPILISSALAEKVVEKKKTKKQLREEAPFIFKEELEKLGNDKWKPKQIVYNYFLRKNMVFDNVKQFDTNVGRFLVPAQQLEGYSWKQISATMDYLDNKNLTWTLETIARNIAEVANRK